MEARSGWFPQLFRTVAQFIYVPYKPESFEHLKNKSEQ